MILAKIQITYPSYPNPSVCHKQKSKACNKIQDLLMDAYLQRMGPSLG